MSTVTTTAVHFTLSYRVGIRFHRLRALLLMTIETHVRLGRGMHHRIALRVTDVAVRACDSIVVVCATVPTKSRVALMTFNAIAVLLDHWRCRVWAEPHYGRSFLAAPYTCRMIPAWTMTRFALKLAMPEGRPRVARYRMRCSKYGQGHLVIMTGETGIGALLAVRNLSFRFFRCLSQANGRDQAA